MIDTIVDASAVHIMNSCGFSLPGRRRTVYHADLGRSMDFYYFGVVRKWRLPERDYNCGSAISRTEYRSVTSKSYGLAAEGRAHGGGFQSSATPFARVRLRGLPRAPTKSLAGECYRVTSFLVDPYQLGHENEEAIESGSFWFYYKLGFRPELPEVARLAEHELQKITVRPGYRTRPAVLRKLAAGPVVYDCGL